MSFRHEAIYKLYPEIVTSVDNKSYNSSGKLVNVDENAVAKKIADLEAEYEANEYQRDRASAYPSWQDQMDLLYHGGVDALKAELKKTKDKYPKPT